MTTNKIDSFCNSLKIKTQQISDRISAHPSVRYLKQKEDLLAKKLDGMPKASAVALHVIPGVNIFSHYLKERALNNRLPALHAHAKAEYKVECLTRQVKELRERNSSLDKAISDLTQQREEFLAAPQDTSKGLKGLKARMGRKVAGWQVSESRIKDLRDEKEKGEKRLNNLTPLLTEALAEKQNHKADLADAEANGEVEAVHKERKYFRNTFRIGLAVATAVAIAAVALSAFSLIPAFIGFGALLLIGGGVGIHIANSMAHKWEVDGKLSFKEASFSD